MANRNSGTRCVYCLKISKKITDDHVFPKSWYPKNTSINLEKWNVPSCEKCNSKLGKVEEDLRTHLGLCLDPNDERSLGIPDTVLRSLDPCKGRNERDKHIRKERRRKIISEINTPDSSSLENVLPNFGKIPGVKYDQLKLVPVSPEDLYTLIEKIIRGMTYINTNRYIDSSYKIEKYICDDEQIPGFIDFINKFGTIHNRDQAFIVKSAIIENEDFVGLYSIEIWGKLKLFASVLPSASK